MIHYSFLGYMIACAIIMIVCVIAYRFFMENKVRPNANRMILLAIYGISFVLPVIIPMMPESYNGAGIEIGKLELTGIIVDSPEKQTESISSISTIILWLSGIYILGFFITVIISFLTIGHLVFLLKKSKKKEIEGIEVLVHNNKKLYSFSWCNKIFIYENSLSTDIKEVKMLLIHESMHIEKMHWIDLSLAQIVLIFQWFNPSAWFIKKELQRIHEYEADEAVLKTGIGEKEYQMLLINNISGSRYSGLTDGLNNCSLKKRIIMMKKTKFKKDWVVRGIAVCGFAILGAMIIRVPAVASVLEVSPSFSEKAVTLNEIKGETEEDKMETVVNKKKGELQNYPDAYIEVDKPAEYVGGETQLLKDLSSTITYPEEAMEKNLQGRVVVRFQINTNGTLSKCEVAYSQNPIFNEAAIKAVENLPGKWEPGVVNGKPVASVFNMPVTFKLQN